MKQYTEQVQINCMKLTYKLTCPPVISVRFITCQVCFYLCEHETNICCYDVSEPPISIR